MPPTGALRTGGAGGYGHRAVLPRDGRRHPAARPRRTAPTGERAAAGRYEQLDAAGARAVRCGRRGRRSGLGAGAQCRVVRGERAADPGPPAAPAGAYGVVGVGRSAGRLAGVRRAAVAVGGGRAVLGRRRRAQRQCGGAGTDDGRGRAGRRTVLVADRRRAGAGHPHAAPGWPPASGCAAPY